MVQTHAANIASIVIILEQACNEKIYFSSKPVVLTDLGNLHDHIAASRQIVEAIQLVSFSTFLAKQQFGSFAFEEVFVLYPLLRQFM